VARRAELDELFTQVLSLLRALVKKVVFDELQFFPRNSTVERGMCVKPKEVLN
jgi:hypothetical protein